MNVLTPTLVELVLFIKDILSDILCCLIQISAHAMCFVGRFAVQCGLLVGLPR